MYAFFLAWALAMLPMCTVPTVTMQEDRHEITWLTESSAHLHIVHVAYVDVGDDRDIYEAIETYYVMQSHISDDPIWTFRINGQHAYDVPALWATPRYPPSWCSLPSVDAY